jgi:ABC-type dipeptide/oligopeptide/nickel transport system ATPase subunit
MRLMSTALSIENITVRYGRFTALDNVSLSLEQHTTLGLVGESGSGKSTVARVIMDIIRPDSGEIMLGGRRLGKKRSRAQHKAIQMVFQNPDASLNPRLKIKQIFYEGLTFFNIVGRGELRQRSEEILGRVGIDPDALERYPYEFSGGQRQRIAIARALSLEPDILIADEPTSALDVSVQLSVLEMLGELKTELGLTMLFISHDMGVINEISDSVAVMRRGRIVEVNDKKDFFLHPQTQYSRELLSAVPRMPDFGGKSI